MRETNPANNTNHLDTPPWEVTPLGQTVALPGGGYARTIQAPGIDDGTRAAASHLIGEDRVRAHEIETVQQYPQLGVAIFRAMGIPMTSIAAGYAAAWEDATRS